MRPSAPPPRHTMAGQDGRVWLCPSTASTVAAPPQLVFDLPQPSAPGLRLWRSTAAGLPAQAQLSTAGLAGLRASGSGQFSLAGLRQLQATLQPQGPLVVVDLRKEPHGFCDGEPLSWYGWRNGVNTHLSAAQAGADEQRRLAALQQQSGTTITAAHVGKERTASTTRVYFVPADLQLQHICSEAAALAAAGMGYIRLPMTDHTGVPDATTIGRFVALACTRSAWWHLHCRKGKGRTTLFLVLLDILHNAKQVSLPDIIARQHALGSADMGAVNPADPDKSRRRQAFVAAFYTACRSRPLAVLQQARTWEALGCSPAPP